MKLLSLKKEPPPVASEQWLKRAAVLLASSFGLVGALAAATIPLSNLLIKPRLKRLGQLRNPRLARFLQTKGWPFQKISFCSFDGKRLHGWWLLSRPERPTIILLHGVKGNRTSMIRFAITLCEADFNVLLFDGRAHGESEGDYVTYGYHERRDVEAAIEFLKQQGVAENRIGLLGLSMGAAIALQVAALNHQIHAVWADSPFASLLRVSTEFIQRVTRLPESVLLPIARTTFAVAGYRAKFDPDFINPINTASQVHCPVRLVHGTQDELISYEHSQLIYDQLGSSDKDLWIIEGAAHTTCLRRGGQRYQERLIDFFNTALAG